MVDSAFFRFCRHHTARAGQYLLPLDSHRGVSDALKPNAPAQPALSLADWHRGLSDASPPRHPLLDFSGLSNAEPLSTKDTLPQMADENLFR